MIQSEIAYQVLRTRRWATQRNLINNKGAAKRRKRATTWIGVSRMVANKSQINGKSGRRVFQPVTVLAQQTQTIAVTHVITPLFVRHRHSISLKLTATMDKIRKVLHMARFQAGLRRPVWRWQIVDVKFALHS
jgi:hypothetical protein